MGNELRALPQKRIEWIDTARGLGLMLVFIGHIKPPYVATWIYTFHMPLFFFLSGLVFSMHPFRTFFQKKFQRLVIPYFCLGIVIYIFYACIYAYENRNSGDYWIMLWNFLEQKAFWTIWFLAALFISELLLWIELKICKQNFYFTLLLSVTLMGLTFGFYRLGGSTLPWCFDVACVAQFFVLIGYIFKKKYIGFSPSKSQIYICAPIFLFINLAAGMLCIKISHKQLDMSVGLYGNEILTLISALAGIGFVILICQLFTNRFFTYLGRNTMIFFGWHSRIILVACGMAYGALGLFSRETLLSEVLYVLTTLVIILATLYPTTELMKKSKIGHLFGV